MLTQNIFIIQEAGSCLQVGGKEMLEVEDKACHRSVVTQTIPGLLEL
jgi:hypothetical protein